MVIINPWGSYRPEDIPDLNPRNKKEANGCICSVIAFCLSSIIFVAFQYMIFEYGFERLRLTTDNVMLLIVLNIIIYIILTILFMKLSFKISDKL